MSAADLSLERDFVFGVCGVRHRLAEAGELSLGFGTLGHLARQSFFVCCQEWVAADLAEVFCQVGE